MKRWNKRRHNILRLFVTETWQCKSIYHHTLNLELEKSDEVSSIQFSEPLQELL